MNCFKRFRKNTENCEHEHHPCGHKKPVAGGALYFFGFIGAAVYFISQAGSFWLGVLGFLKAAVWPAFLVYHALEFLIK